jgi:hypothetical protein
MLASELYAIANTNKNDGPHECHWCGSKCTDFHRADFVPRQQQDIGIRVNTTFVKRPSSAYECWGCWLWKRKRVTANFLTTGFQDGQWAGNHSWIITETYAKAIRPWDVPALYEILVKPPLRFVLTLLSNGPILSGILPMSGTPNLLQAAVCNDLVEIRDNTPIYFTLNNIQHYYTVMDLLHDAAEPGTQALTRVIGPVPEKLLPEKESENGRPPMVPKHYPGKQLIAASGLVLA